MAIKFIHHHYIHNGDEQKLDQIIKGQEEIKALIIQSVTEPAKLKELAKKLDEGQNKLQEAIDKNTS